LHEGCRSGRPNTLASSIQATPCHISLPAWPASFGAITMKIEFDRLPPVRELEPVPRYLEKNEVHPELAAAIRSWLARPAGMEALVEKLHVETDKEFWETRQEDRGGHIDHYVAPLAMWFKLKREDEFIEKFHSGRQRSRR
jgi:hypothetical protein